MAETKRVAVLLADGFEEAEAVVFIDIMRRLKIEVDVLSIHDRKPLSSYFKTLISADYLLSEKSAELYDAVMMPGGPMGTDNLTCSSKVIEFLKIHIAEDKWICALCSSGAKVLAANKLLGQHHYTTGGGLEKNFSDGVYIDQPVVVDAPFISAKGLGVSFEFAFTVAAKLFQDNKDVDWQADHIYFSNWPLNH